MAGETDNRELKSLVTLTAADVMKPDVMSVRSDMTAREAGLFLIENGISGALVLNGDEKASGVLSLTDIVEGSGENRDFLSTANPNFYRESWGSRFSREEITDLHVEDADVLVEDIMTPTVFTVPEGTPLSQVAQTMVSGHIHRLFVTGPDGDVTGIITTMDILRVLPQLV